MITRFRLRHFLTGLILLMFSPICYGQAPCGVNDSTYQILFGTSGSDMAYDVIGTSDSGLLMAGVMPFFTGGGHPAGTLVKLSRSGQPQWVRQWVASPLPTLFYRVIETSDKNFIALGYLGKGSGANTLVIKMTPAGTLLWRKEIAIPSSGEQFGLMLTETNDGHVVISTNVNNQNTAIVQAQLLKLNATNGTLIWERQFRFNTTAEARSMIADGAHIVVVGVVNGPAQTMNDGFVMKLDHSNGNMLWMKMIESEGRMNRLLDIKKTGNQYLLVMQNGLAGDNDVKPALLTIDTDGNLLTAQQFDFAPKNKNNYPGRWVAVCRNGDIVQAYGENKGAGSASPVMARFSPTGTLKWAYEYRTLSNLYINRITEDANGHIAMVGTASETAAQPTQFLAIKAAADGTIAAQDAGSCTPQAFTVTTSTAPVTFYNDNWISNAAAGAQSLDANVNAVTLALPPANTCTLQNSCASLTLSGPSSICTGQGDLEILATRNAGCKDAVSWTFDPALADLVSSSDSKLVLRPKATSNVNLRIDARLGGCAALQATFTVAVIKTTPLLVSLGKDSTICSSSHTLSGPAGMTQYTWSNGSAQPSINVNSTGNYWLRVTDGCGQTAADTIALVFAPSATFTLGPDAAICGSTPLNLQGPANMQAYLWSDGSTSMSTTVTSAGLYWLETTDRCGQSFRDSIRINAAPAAQAFSLGGDIVSCQSIARQLSAPAGMAAYLWSNGSTSPSITVSQPGLYWARITDACQGQAADSLNIVTLPSPQVQLGPDTSLCGSTPLVLDAGNPGSQYLWSTGETTRTISVNTSGSYSVTVTSSNGCSSTDNMQVSYAGTDLQGYQMPSAFTPNKDGLNDCFGLRKWGDVTLLRFEVFNRWGEKVFEGRQPTDCWNGTWRGQEQPAGHFAYIVIADTPCGRVEQKGLVALIR